MKITKETKGEDLVITLEGRLDTTTAPELETVVHESLDGVKSLVLNFDNLEYVSSAGLRVLLTAQKIMNTQGSMKLTGVNSDIMEVFEITGFTDILTIE